MPGHWARTAPADGVASRSRAVSDIMSAGIMTGMRGARCNRGRRRRENPAASRRSAPRNLVRSRTLGCESPKGRAAVERRKASAPCRVRAATRVAEDRSASYGVPHPSFSFLCFVARASAAKPGSSDQAAWFSRMSLRSSGHCYRAIASEAGHHRRSDSPDRPARWTKRQSVNKNSGAKTRRENGKVRPHGQR
jgi:hypothetical protein